MDISPLDFIGFIMPPIIDAVNQFVPDSRFRFWVSLLICAVIAALVNLDKITTEPTTVLLKVGFVFAQAQIIYKQYWEKSTVRDRMFQ